jgi:hypothetical protein
MYQTIVRRYAVIDPEENFAHGRVEQTVFFTKNVLNEHIFCERSKSSTIAVAGDISVLYDSMPGLNTHRVSPV